MSTVHVIQGMPLATSDPITIEVLTVSGEITSTAAGTTAHVAHTAHGFAVGDLIRVTGATQSQYNGAFAVATVTGANDLTYPMLATATNTTAGGTIYQSRVLHIPTAYMGAAATRITTGGFARAANGVMVTPESKTIRVTHSLPGVATYPTPGAAGTGVGHPVAALATYEATGEDMVNGMYATIGVETDTTAYVTITPYIPTER